VYVSHAVRTSASLTVAADVLAGYIADEAVVLVVLGLADSGPGRGAVDDGEGVCEKLVGFVV
jgi:hypothetical protein